MNVTGQSLRSDLSVAEAVLKLLDDDNRTVATAAAARMRRFFVDDPRIVEKLHGRAAPDQHRILERLWDDHRVDELAARLGAIQRRSDGPDALEKGLFTIARYRDADLAADPYREMLDGWGTEAARRVAGRKGGRRRLEGLCRYLFAELGLRGNASDYHDPDNSFLHIVLERRLGIPITLSSVMVLVGRRAGLPIEGVGMPRHYIVKMEDARGVLYVDPFDRGKFLSTEACRGFIRRCGVPFEERFLDATGAAATLERVLDNLTIAYTGRGEPQRAESMRRMARALGG